MNIFDSTSQKKIILITGGSRGIGATTAMLLASKGHLVAINYKNSDSDASELVKKIIGVNGSVLSVKGDISDEADATRIFKTIEAYYGSVQAVVHCASPNPVPQTFESLDWEIFQKHFDIQIKGAFHCVKLALKNMIETGSGSFVFLSSIFAEGVPPSQQSAYVTTKAGLAAMARSLAVEYGPKGIRFNVVSPGMTQTEMISNIPEKVKIMAKMATPLRRLAETEDIANTIEFLLSPSAHHITGENIRVCGGILM
jgi:3-oxoacyl-[acyl-carrier protein] reductase